MKKALVFLLVVAAGATNAWAKGVGTFDITVSPLFGDVLNISNRDVDKPTGVGAYLHADYQVLEWMSLGIGGGQTQYKKNGVKTNVESLDLMGRLILPNVKGPVTPYLIGGFGYRPLMKDKADYWQGHYHAEAGIGARYDLTQSGTSGLVLEVVGNAYSPKKVVLKTGDVRVGYSISFGGTHGPKKAGSKPAAKPATPAVAPAAGSSWLPKPFSASKAYATLTESIVPSRVKANQLNELTADAKLFFNKLNETGVKGDEYNKYCAGYFTSLASSLYDSGDKTRAQACVEKALKFVPNYKDAVDLQKKWAPAAAASPAVAAANGAWIPTPFSPTTAFAKLKTELIPAKVKAGDLAGLTAEAKPFFAKLSEAGIKDKEYNSYCAGYFTAMASELYNTGDKTRAQACIEKALKFVPDYSDALALKQKWGLPSSTPAAVSSIPSPVPTVTNWLPNPFDADKAYAKLKTELVPARVNDGKLTDLTAEAKLFFNKLNETGIKGDAYNKYCAGYFTALGSELAKKGDTARAVACADKALKFVPDFKDAVDLKAKLSAAK